MVKGIYKRTIQHIENISGSGNSFFGKKHSDDTKLRLSKTLKEQFANGRTPWNKGLTKETNQSIKKSGQKLSNTRKKMFELGELEMSSETIKKILKSREGYRHSKQTKINIGLGNLGRIISEGQRMITSKLRKGKSYEEVVGKKRASLWKKRIGIKTVKAMKAGKFNIYPNKPETKMINLFKENNFNFTYTGDGKRYFIGQNHSFNPDFVDENSKKVVEVFGDYWHNREGMKERDEERVKTYLQHGYETLVIWEHELENPNQVLNKVQEFII